MKVVNLRLERREQTTRAAATLVWEQSQLPAQDIYIEAPNAYAFDMACNPDAFLIAAALPAMYYGEDRIFVEGAICPVLKDGLKASLAWIYHWFRKGNPHLRIEGATRSHADQENKPARTASFFTGGVDSWSNLLTNHQHYSAQHPYFIRDCFVVYGLQRVKRSDFDRAFEAIAPLGQHINATFIPIFTNIYGHLIDGDTDYQFWKNAYNGAALAAIAHIFTKRYNHISIASGNDIPNLVPLGTHPVLDPYFSSYNLRISHDGVTYSRFEKTQLIAESGVALQNLRVCDMPEIPNHLHNCGTCEKCVRTAVTLEALGVLQHTQVFPYQRLSAKQLAKSCYIKHSGIAAIYQHLIPNLEVQGRGDLAAVLQAKLRRYRLEAFDDKYFQGRCFAFVRGLKALLKQPSEPQPWQQQVENLS